MAGKEKGRFPEFLKEKNRMNNRWGGLRLKQKMRKINFDKNAELFKMLQEERE